MPAVGKLDGPLLPTKQKNNSVSDQSCSMVQQAP